MWTPSRLRKVYLGLNWTIRQAGHVLERKLRIPSFFSDLNPLNLLLGLKPTEESWCSNCLLKERPYLAIALLQKKQISKCTHFTQNAPKCMHFTQNALKYSIFNEKSHLASRFWWEQSEVYHFVSENRLVTFWSDQILFTNV